MTIPALNPQEKDIERIVAVIRQIRAEVESRSAGTGRIPITNFAEGVGTGNQAADDAALAAAITYLNDRGTEARTCIYYPPGTYKHGPCEIVLSATQCAIEGEPGAMIEFYPTTTDQAWLLLGAVGAPAQRVEIIGIDIDFSPTGAVPPLRTKFLNMQNTFDVHVEGCYFRNFVTILHLGTTSDAASGCYSTVMRECSGFGYNINGAAMLLNYGAGLYMSDLQFYVAGVAVSPQNTASGRNFIQNGGTGSWDTCQLINSFLQFFDITIALTANNGCICINFFMMNNVYGNNLSYGVYMEGNIGGVILGVFLSGCWLDNYGGDNVLITGTGGFHGNHKIINNIFVGAGASNVRVNPTHFISGGMVVAYNRCIGANKGGAATGAIEIADGTDGFNIVGNTGNIDDSGIGLNTRAPYGIVVGINCDHYGVTANAMMGSTGSYLIGGDAIASFARRVHNNQYADLIAFGGYVTVGTLGAVATWTNTTPFVYEVYVSGGTVANMIVLGQAVALTHGTFRVEPGEVLSVNAAVLPVFDYRIMG